MWEAVEMENEDYLWAGIPFIGGIAGHQEAPCGAVSAAAIFLGLKYRCSSGEKEKAKTGRQKARTEAAEFVRDFKNRFGSINCRDLLGYDFSDLEAAKKARESQTGPTCEEYVCFALEKLCELDDNGPEG